MSIRLYSYWRSSAAYRVRIALNLKGLDHEIVPVSLAPGVSEHRGDAYRAKNPQMLVPFLEDGEMAIAQSMAILEYLEETYPGVKLLPQNEPARSKVRSFCNLIACDCGRRRGLLLRKGASGCYQGDQRNSARDHGTSPCRKIANGAHKRATALQVSARRWPWARR